MLKEYRQHINKHFPELLRSKLLITVSGGLDSVVLLHLCHTLKLNVAVAHCNFNLRGKASDADSEFVKVLAEDLNVPFHLENFNTAQFSKDHKLSTQISARELRYSWFHQLTENFKYDYILTAHHLNDSVETFMINLSRGTGLEGLNGIPSKNGNIIRPLLPFTRTQIEAYAKTNDITWREDESNASDNYLRNSIRHHIVPKLEELNPQFLQAFSKTQDYLQQTSFLLDDYTSLLYNDLVTETFKGFEISLSKLKTYNNQDAILFQLLKSFGFSDWNKIYDLKSAQTGKVVLSETHRLIKNREVLLLTSLDDKALDSFVIEKDTTSLNFQTGRLVIETVSEISDISTKTLYVDADLLHYPLTLRPWQHGDRFKPLGMKGTKKLSDFLKDEKLSLPQKEQTYVLISNDTIVWVVGHRADDRFKITNTTQHITRIIWQA